MRINVGINPELLSDEHLLAEEREIAMVPGTFKRIGDKDVPPVMNLGKGYIKFFMDKAEYTLDRYMLVHNECLRRGFLPKDKSHLWFGVNMKSNPFEYGEREINLIKNRIIDKTRKSPKEYFHYNGTRDSKINVITRLNIDFEKSLQKD